MLVTAVVVIPDELVAKAKQMGMPYDFIQTELGKTMRNSFKAYIKDESAVLHELSVAHGKEKPDRKSVVDNLKEFLGSEEGKAYTKKYKEDKEKKNLIYQHQLLRFHQRFSDASQEQFDEFVTKVLEKYHSDEYAKRWYSRGIEPKCQLLYYLFGVAEKHGRGAKQDLWRSLQNQFTQDIRIYKKHAFMFIMGQGSGITVFRKEGAGWRRL